MEERLSTRWQNSENEYDKRFMICNCAVHPIITPTQEEFSFLTDCCRVDHPRLAHLPGYCYRAISFRGMPSTVLGNGMPTILAIVGAMSTV